ncbi:glucose-1-phosphate adenylyltransferase subunit GlgD [Salisediminibacterium selenitireducens]|uniref:Glucose-1-phosphate adenylyltransferase, GlgD subunit n=1 Tax=Bacillus selenitireducens (strain ATCC 700615 / DSM 15326 / MLS10) TaxID=439292 RepID=D6XSH7_BACIE|nr:glucose-1-phosphate adenylyltransferase subunit GlgD [Salisediminibacterium selenitireducens]ADH98763.1 glucose-1-phosphate adenylyltransferase, GlgD subunit [[Bacillus] selenitireducens MLS10]
MEPLLGLINLDNEHDFLEELTYFRCGAATPFAGRYRMIDFTLSNMVNSGVEEVAIFTNHKYRALMDHIKTGADWELARRHGRVFILPPDWNDPTDISRGDLRHFHNNRDFFHRSKAENVIISGSQYLTNVNALKAYEYHLERDADVTVIQTNVPEPGDEHRQLLRIESDEDGWVKGFSSDPANSKVFTNVYIIKKEVLLQLVDFCIAYHKDNFFLDGVRGKLPDLKIQHYSFNGYGMFINSIQSYYKNNLSLLQPDNYKKLFFKNQLIKTKLSNEPPAKYVNGSAVTKSMVSNGCVIEGTVDNSVLFRGVKISPTATVKNSIIMQRCVIEDNVHLENVILDKDVHVSAGQQLIGSKDKPYVVAKRQRV